MPHPGPILRSPFAATTPGIAAMLVYGLAAAVWVVAGDALPGGRWLAVHLFTLGVLSNAVLTFSQHFAHTVTRSPGDVLLWPTIALNVGVLATLTAIPLGSRGLLAGGATAASVAVTGSYLAIRRARRSAVGARFGWIARAYERAHGAFLHGAILGGLLGTGVLGGTWYGSARSAHLHVNILGWGMSTLLATLVFFGPTMARTRIAPGADAVAARVLRHGATALTFGVVGLLATGADGGWSLAGRVVATIGIGGFAAAATVVVSAVVGAALRAQPSAAQPLVIASGAWLVAVVWVDVAVVAAAAWDLLDVIGIATILGVLTQSIAATLVYLAPSLRESSTAGRRARVRRLDRRATTRTVLLDLGILAIVLAAVSHAAGTGAPLVARAGWLVVLAVLVRQAVLALGPTVEPSSEVPVRPG